MPRAYLICATPRSGSTMLCDLLTQTTVAGQPNSYFRPGSMASFAAQFDLPTPDGTAFSTQYLAHAIKVAQGVGPLIGLRSMWNGMGPLQTRLGQLYPAQITDLGRLQAAFGDIRFIHLRRHDQLGQAISRVRAEQSGLWHRNQDGSVREQVGPGAQAAYDRTAIEGFVEEQRRDHAAWEGWFHSHQIDAHTMTYEALSADPQDIIGKILGILGQSQERARGLAPGTAKLADDTSRTWAERFRAETQGTP